MIALSTIRLQGITYEYLLCLHYNIHRRRRRRRDLRTKDGTVKEQFLKQNERAKTKG